MKTLKKALKIAKNTFSVAILAIMIVVLCFIFFASKPDTGFSFFGKSYLRILTGSMNPTYAPTDVVKVDTTVKYEDLAVGDVITFKTIIRDQNVLVSHRIVAFTSDGEIVTKGDNNPTIDSLRVNKDTYVGKVLYRSAFLSFLFKLITDKMGYFIVVLLPGMACTLLDTAGFLSALFFFFDAKKSEILASAKRWMDSTVNLPKNQRSIEYKKKFGRYRKILEGEGFYFEYMADSDQGKLIRLSKLDIAVEPFSKGDCIFTSIEVLKENRLLQQGKKQVEVPILVPQSNKEDDFKNENVKMITISKFTVC